MKIGIDGRAAKWYRGTGIGTYTYQLIKSLNNVDSYNDYLMFLPQGSSLDTLKKNFKIKAVAPNVGENFWDEVSVPNILDDYKMDLYHVPQNGVGLSENINCQKAITLHDIIPLKMPETVSDRYIKIFNEEMPKMLKNCQGIITVSEFSKEDIANTFNFPKDKIYVTHLAAEDIYKPISKAICKNILKSKYGIDDRYILYVGGFSPRKNIIGLIESFSLIPENRRKNVKLIITGKKGLSYDRYRKRAEDLGILDKIVFTGFIPLEDLPIFYSAAEVLVYPSFYEGFGLPPLEAMACGTAVIASNLTSIPEVCGDAALFIDPYNIDELSNAIESVLNDSILMLTMVKKGLLRAENFSWDKTARKTIDAYEDMLK